MTLRHFLADDDLTAAEQRAVLDRALALKAAPFSDRCLEGPRTVSILFDKPTLRTQVSFVGAVAGLGGFPMVVDGRLAGVGVRESVADVARILGPQSAAVVWRTFAQAALEEMAAYAGVPVVNALTDDYHPCQILADLLTVLEAKGSHRRADLRLRRRRRQQHGALLPARLARSPACTCASAPRRPTRPGPTSWPARRPSRPSRAARCWSPTTRSPRSPAPTSSPPTPGSRWGSRPRPRPARAPTARSPPSGSPTALMAQAAADAVFLHCLPAYRGYEVDAEVIDGPASLVWQEAENRLHAQKALLSWLVEQHETGETR